MKRGYVNMEKAARSLGVSRRAVRKMVMSGELETAREGEGLASPPLVSVASVERLLSGRDAASESGRLRRRS